MSDRSERRARGMSRLSEIARVPAFEPPDAFVAATIDSVFGELWQRRQIPDRERRMITLTIVGTRGLEFEIETHLRGALASGDLDPGDVVELILQLAYYAGWPCASIAYRRFRAVCGELGLDVPGPEEAD